LLSKFIMSEVLERMSRPSKPSGGYPHASNYHLLAHIHQHSTWSYRTSLRGFSWTVDLHGIFSSTRVQTSWADLTSPHCRLLHSFRPLTHTLIISIQLSSVQPSDFEDPSSKPSKTQALPKKLGLTFSLARISTNIPNSIAKPEKSERPR